ncbi:MAG: FG-GAP-like repeat-containing protein [Myxococcota bacterium]
MLKRVATSLFVFAGVWAASAGAARAACGPWFGDVDGNFRVDVADALCLRAAVSHARAGLAPPVCQAEPAASDLDCDGVLGTADVLTALHLAQGIPLDPARDLDADGCPDACAATCPGPACLEQGRVLLSRRDGRARLVSYNQPDPITYPGGQWWMHGALAVADFDRDGHPDVYAAGGGGEPDRLFINNGKGVFVDQAAAWGLAQGGCAAGAAAADVDGDGFVDLFVTGYGAAGQSAQNGGQRLYRNMGGARFEDRTAELRLDYLVAGVPSPSGAAFGDYDLDGDLDLFVASWWAIAPGAALGNRMFRNDGAAGFTDVTASTVGAVVDGTWGFQPAFADMDGDLYPELLLAGDFETSRYFQNMGGGKFKDRTLAAGLGLDDNGMGQAIGDFDGDGRLDWYVTSVHQDNPPVGKNTGNMLYRNLGSHHYEELSRAAGVNDGGWGWGAVAVDLDQDGWLDLVEVNGRPSPTPSGQWVNERAKLFRNQGGGRFAEVAAWAGLEHTGQGRAIAALDADGDGDMDLVISSNSGPLHYYENRTARAGGWLQVRLDTRSRASLAPEGYGAEVTAYFGGRVVTRIINGAPSYLATSEAMAHFGLAGAGWVDRLEIRWSRGQVTRLDDVAAGQRLVVKAPRAADVNADGRVDAADLHLVAKAQGLVKGPESMAADVDADGVVGPADLALVSAAMSARLP